MSDTSITAIHHGMSLTVLNLHWIPAQVSIN